MEMTPPGVGAKVALEPAAMHVQSFAEMCVSVACYRLVLQAGQAAAGQRILVTCTLGCRQQ